MPLVEITYASHVPEETLRELGSVLPHLISLAVECPEEPYDGDLQPGDVALRFRELGPFDRGNLDVVIEVRSKYSESRAADRQDRVDRLHGSIAKATGLEEFGVYLCLPVAAWAQGDEGD
ncbi:hypothetical protein [Kibdelosporangium phytohabitans]|uniref:5-carboxymethyl-2-hydroxymuconate isomerase n=1 Tax=Kibdelosporangium phytohabitans TaxID=860235 RepID=A0A0N9IIR9_9PSEU|nr:hypothetical protein [Kibdelosporangium phytohabitans]ALG14962.1 hypothetical protein AOZ06_21905 [Kibdelosporangium phytohabitans]MBE1469556.1 hypothetical protein [Kibdelosporangium phytohabitans]